MIELMSAEFFSSFTMAIPYSPPGETIAGPPLLKKNSAPRIQSNICAKNIPAKENFPVQEWGKDKGASGTF
jgi:hypothetical protein